MTVALDLSADARQQLEEMRARLRAELRAAATPNESGRDLVAEFHDLMRTIDGGGKKEAAG